MTCVIPSQSHNILLFLMPVVQCIVAQWRLVSSESAVTLLLSVLHTCSHKPWITWDILLVLITVAGNLCNKCPKQLLEQNSSYSDHFNAISGLYRTAEPQEALWQQFSGGSRIFPRGCANSQKCYYFFNILPKAAWKWKNLDSPGDPPMQLL